MPDLIDKLQNEYKKSHNSIDLIDKLNYEYNIASGFTKGKNVRNISKEKRETEQEIAKYKRKEKLRWWDEKKNPFENIGNVAKKLFVGNEYAQDDKYDALQKKYSELKKLENQQYLDEHKPTFGDKLGAPFVGGVARSSKGIESIGKKLLGQKTNTEPMVEEQLANRIRQDEKNGAWKVYQDITNSVGGMLPSIAVGGAIGSKGALATSFGSYGGSSYNEARREGKTEEQATKYGVATGLLETGLQKVLGGLTSIYGKSALSSVSNKILNNVVKNPTLRNTIASVGSEGFEEYLQDIFNPVVRNVTMSEKNKSFITNDKGNVKFNPSELVNEDALYSGLMGALTSGLIEGTSNISNQMNKNKTIPNVVPKSMQKNNTNEDQPFTNTVFSNNIPQNGAINNSMLENKRIAENSYNFAKQVDEVMVGRFPQKDMLNLGSTPKVLQNLGIKNLPITMTQKHLDTIMNKSGKYTNSNYHDLGIDVVKKLPKALSDPLNVVKSSTKDNSIVVITDLADKQERPVIASIKIDGHGVINNIEIDSNVMTSAYGRNNYDSFMVNNRDNIIYDVDEQKKENSAGIQYPRSTTSFSNNNISQNDNTVNNSNMQIVEKNTVPPMTNEVRNTVDSTKIANLLNKRPEMIKKTFKEEIEDTKQQVVNKGYYVDKLAKATDNKELIYKYDKMLGSQAEGHYAIGLVQTNNNGKAIGKSVIDLWQPVEKVGKTQEFSDYLLQKHNIDRMVQGKPVFGENITSEMSQKKVAEYEQSNPQFIQWEKDINNYNKNQLQNMVDAGLTSEESQRYLNNTYDSYVRINRDLNGNGSINKRNSKLKVNSPIRKAKGGNQDIFPLRDSMAQQAIEVKNAIRRNEFGLELLNTLGGEQDLTFNGKDYVLKNEDGTYSFTVFKNGNPVKIEIDEGLFKALEPSRKMDWEDTLPAKAVQKVSSIQRNLLTVDNPLFILRNFFKDIGDAPFNSKYTSKFFPNYIKAIKQIKNNGEHYQMYKALGGEQNTYFEYERGVKLPTKNIVKKFVDKIQTVNEAVEQAPRLAEFISTLEAGGTKTEAMYNASEVTTNFKRGGELTKVLNRNGATFLNASVQGFDKQIRNFTGQNGAKGYVNILLKATLLGILPSIINEMLLGDDDEYKDLPDYVKDTYYLFKTDDNKFLRIPKGRVMSVFGSAARRTLETINGEKNAWDNFFGFKGLIANQIAPNNPLEDNIVAPITGILNNRSWNGSEIVPRRLQDELPENQYDEKTDGLSKAIGSLFKISPKKVNYLLDQYSGGIGDAILPLMTPKAEQNPLASAFTTDSVLANKNVNNFFDILDRQSKVKNSPRATEEDVLKSKYLNSKQAEMNNLYKEKREIEMSSLTDKEKKISVREIQEKINSIAKESLNTYEKVEKDTNYSKIGNLEFYKNSKNEWKKITDDMLKKQEKILQKNFKLNTYYKNYSTLNSIMYDDNLTKSKKKENITNSLISSNLSNEQKAYLYGNYYSTPKTMDLLTKANIPMNAYLKLQNNIKDIEGIEDTKSLVAGRTISGSKKRQVVREIAKLPISAEHKTVLIALSGYSVDTSDRMKYNDQYLNKRKFKTIVFNYVNKQKLSIPQKREILEKAGFKILKNGKVKGW